MNIKAVLRRNKFIYTLRRRLLAQWRNWRYGLKHVHPTFFAQSNVEVARDLRAGAYSYIGKYCSICPMVEIGKYVMFAPRVAIVGGDHLYEVAGTPMIFSGRPQMPKTVIDDDVWIGINSTIKAGVHIGRGAIVAAGSAVTKDVEPYSIYGGVPAKKIRDRFNSDSDREKHDQMLSGELYAGNFCDPK